MPKQSKPHPEGLTEVSRIKPTRDIQEYVNTLSKDIEDEKSERSKWEASVDLLDKLRFGVRGKKVTPWKDCANYSIPVIDNDIRKLKPDYVNLHYGVSPVATFVPYGPEDVEPMEKREMLHDWRLRTQVDFFKPYVIGIDHILGAKGQTVFRIIWNYSTRKYAEFIDINEFPEDVIEALYDPRTTDEILGQIIIEQYKIDETFEENLESVAKAVEDFRAGKTEIEIDLLEEENNEPEIKACDVVKDLVVPTDTKHIQDARFIDYKFWVTKNELLISIRDGKYEKQSEHDIDSWVDEPSSNEVSNDALILLHETCCWYDSNSDGIAERCIVTWPEEDPEAVLRFIELPYEHGEWPYVQVKREILDDNFYSGRGLPSLKEDFQRGITTSVNQAIDHGTIMNSPERVARKNILTNPKNRRYIPGELVITNGPISEYETRQGVNTSQPLMFQQAQYLKSWSDQTTGEQTSGMSSQTDLSGMGERGKKTAKEVEALTAIAQQDKSLDMMVFQQQMAGVHHQIDALYYQFGDEEQEIQITGQETMKMSRDEIQGHFNIVPNGRLDNSTHQQRLQKSMVAFNIGFQNPFINQKKLTERVFKDLDPVMAQNLVYTDEEIQQMQQQQQQQQQQMMQQAIQQQVGTQKMADDLEIRKDVTKEALLTPITGKKFAAD